MVAKGFGEERVGRWRKGRCRGKPNDKQFRHRDHQRVQHAGAEFNLSADEFSAFLLVRLKAMARRPRIEEDTGLIDDSQPLMRSKNLQLTTPQDMQAPGTLGLVVAGQATEAPGVEDTSGESETGEEGGQS